MENLHIPHFGTLTIDQASEFIQQMFEYTSLHDNLKQCRQKAHIDFICPPSGESSTENEKLIIDFHSTWIKNDCSIITDYMLNRCRPLISTAKKQRSLK